MASLSEAVKGTLAQQQEHKLLPASLTVVRACSVLALYRHCSCCEPRR